jgi:uncharacterized protein YjiS (DUF1127 family)
MSFRGFLQRQKQLKARRQTENQFARLTDVDLADMGIKRYQLETDLQG